MNILFTLKNIWFLISHFVFYMILSDCHHYDHQCSIGAHMNKCAKELTALMSIDRHLILLSALILASSLKSNIFEVHITGFFICLCL